MLGLLAGWNSASADTAQYFYDPAGRLVGVLDPVNGSAQYIYDLTGNILQVKQNPLSALVVFPAVPSGGPAGTVVTIGGTGFGTVANTRVKFNGIVAGAPAAVTPTSITVAVPAGATTGPVSVTTPAGTASSLSAFTVSTNAAPSITRLSPTTLSPGATVAVTGSGFDPVPSHDKVFIDGVAARFVQNCTLSRSGHERRANVVQWAEV